MTPASGAPFSFGDLVVHVPQGGSDARRGVGIIAELRRSDCRVLYPRTGTSLWSALKDLRPARPGETEGSLEGLIFDLVELLGAKELEATPLPGGRCRLLLSHGPLPPASVDRVRDMLGERLSSYLIRPQGMRRIQTFLELVE